MATQRNLPSSAVCLRICGAVQSAVKSITKVLLVQISSLVAAVLTEERQLSEEDIVLLFSARGADFELVCAAAGKATPIILSICCQAML